MQEGEPGMGGAQRRPVGSLLLRRVDGKTRPPQRRHSVVAPASHRDMVLAGPEVRASGWLPHPPRDLGRRRRSPNRSKGPRWQVRAPPAPGLAPGWRCRSHIPSLSWKSVWEEQPPPRPAPCGPLSTSEKATRPTRPTFGSVMASSHRRRGLSPWAALCLHSRRLLTMKGPDPGYFKHRPRTKGSYNVAV